MVGTFQRELDARLDERVAPRTRASVLDQSSRLADMKLPENPAEREAVLRAIDESFVEGFRRVALLAAAASAGGALLGFVGLRGARRRR